MVEPLSICFLSLLSVLGVRLICEPAPVSGRFRRISTSRSATPALSPEAWAEAGPGSGR